MLIYSLGELLKLWDGKIGFQFSLPLYKYEEENESSQQQSLCPKFLGLSKGKLRFRKMITNKAKEACNMFS